MRAWTVARNGEPAGALVFKSDWPAPKAPTGSQVMVKISYAGLNPADVFYEHLARLPMTYPHILMYQMANLPSWLPFRRNAIPGLDFVGEIVRAGPAAPPEMQVGTEVCGSLGVRQVAFGAGSLSEFVVVPAELVVVKPVRLTTQAAVGLGVAGQTAAMIMREANVQKGSKILINGASGGVGSILIQIANAKGAYVTAVCSGANEDLVRRLGAGEMIDYTKHEDLYSALADKYKESQLDFVVDCVGDDALFAKSPNYLAPKGKFISIVGGKTQGVLPYLRGNLLPVFLGGTPRTYRILGLAPSGSYAREVAQWVQDEWLTQIPLDSEYTMDETVQAYEKLATKRAKGKIVVKIAS
ncbi:zinc alcohol dehydrogenase [Xylariomycetidae sp. FL2044]|nr:zinc alcohol dehydrogenase [Xylariomycetidae sp. FL2044]